jgi:hypothetical protein
MTGPLLLEDGDRKLAIQLSEIGDDAAAPLRWPARANRDLAAEECRAALALLESQAGQEWSRKWSHGDPEGRVKIAELVTALRAGASRALS